MKILGISFGTRHGNSETLTKAALMGAEESGASVELIRYMDFNVRPCNGCLKCTEPDRLGKCVFDDDFELLMEHILEADGLILASPMYSWGPTDGYRILCDRINAAFNVAYLKRAGVQGCPEMIDQRVFKTRVAGMITVGGTKEETKTVTTVPLMHVLTYGMRIHVLDHVICKDTGAPGGVLAYPDKVAHAHAMGRRIANACGLPEDQLTWAGEARGVCPHCHNELVNFKLGTDTFRCAVCGVEGRLVWKDGRLTSHVIMDADNASIQFMDADNAPIQSMGEMEKLLDEFDALKARWEQTGPAFEDTLKKYENYPVTAFHL